MNTSKIWLSRIYETPKGFLFWLKVAGLALLSGYLITRIFLFFISGWNGLLSIFSSEMAFNSILIVGGTIFNVLVWGLFFALLITNYKFPGSNLFKQALLLPILIPTHVFAFAYDSFLGYTGPLQNLAGWTNSAEWSELFAFNTKNRFWLMFWLSLSLFPYAYLTFLSFFNKQGSLVLEIAKTLKQNRSVILVKVILPLITPIAAASGFLIFILAFNEYGASKYNGIPTLTTGIIDYFKTTENTQNLFNWIGILVIIIAFIYWGKNNLNKNNNADKEIVSTLKITQKTLHRGYGLSAIIFCIAIIFAGFLIPLFELLKLQYQSVTFSKLLIPTLNTVFLTLITVIATVFTFTLISTWYGRWVFPEGLKEKIQSLFVFIFKLPGFMIGLVVFLIFKDATMLFEPVLSGNANIFSTVILLVAYTSYFIGVYLHLNHLKLFSSSLPKMTQEPGIVSTSFLNNFKINLRLKASGIASLILIIFCLKELPIFIVSGNHQFLTLTGYGFNLAFSDLLSPAAGAAIIQMAIGLIPFYFIIAKTANF